MPILCVDLSKWDGNVSIPKLQAAGVGAVIAKCGGGDVGLYTDSKWESNYANCKAAGCAVGAYWYLGATTVAKAKEEAAYCLKLLKGKQFEYPIYVDVEETAHRSMKASSLANVICAFTDAIGAAGFLPGVYSWKWMLEPCGSKVAALEWWVCAWTKTKPCECGMWQFGGETNLLRSTTLAGYKNMDQSYAYVDYPSMVKANGLNGYAKEATVALSIPEKIAQVIEHYAAHAAHGYSQPNRAGDGTTEIIVLSDGTKVVIHGGDVDCSELVRICVNCAISGRFSGPIVYMWTGNESAELTAQGFERMAFSKSKVRRGDILWRSGHTGIACGSSLQAEAAIDENGTIYGPRQGDQTGNEVRVTTLSSDWTHIFRYAVSDPNQGTSDTTTHEGTMSMFSGTFKFKQNTNIRTKPSLKGTKTGQYLKGQTVVLDGHVTAADGFLWGRYKGASTGKYRYVAIATLDFVDFA